MAAVALLAAAPSASAATSLTGEVLSGTKGTESVTGGGPCPIFNGVIYRGTVSFSAHGKASGPYPGSFYETGSFKFGMSKEDRLAGDFKAHFKITSGAHTITGSLSGGSPYVDCTSAGRVGGGFGGPFTYTATISGQTGTGTATGNGPVPLSESFQ